MSSSSDPQDESVELRYYSSATERKIFDAAAALFAILSAIEALESAYIRGALSGGARAEEYKRQCSALLGQYKASVRASAALGGLDGEDVESVEKWARQWDGTFVSAFARVRANAPAEAARDMGATRAAVVMTNAVTRASEVAALRLEERNFLRRDELVLEISAALDAADNCGALLPHDWPHRAKLVAWKTNLVRLAPGEPILETDLKLLKNDLAMALGSWNALVLR